METLTFLFLISTVLLFGILLGIILAMGMIKQVQAVETPQIVTLGTADSVALEIFSPTTTDNDLLTCQESTMDLPKIEITESSNLSISSVMEVSNRKSLEVYRKSIDSFQTAELNITLGDTDIEALSKAIDIPSRYSDIMLNRILDARQRNIEKATVLINEIENWRQTIDIESITGFNREQREYIDNLLPRYHHKHDKLGRPIYFMEYHNANANLMFGPQGVSKELFIIDNIKRYEANEWKMAISYKHNQNSKGQHFLICNLKDARLTQFPQVAPLLKQLFDIMLGYYPDSLGCMMIVNAPYVFTFVWKVVSLWFDERTLNKIFILGTDYQSRLHEMVDLDALPIKYGGTCDCAEFGGCHVSDEGVWKSHQEYHKWASN